MRRLLQSSFLTLVSALSVAGLQAQPYYNQTDSFLKYNSVWIFDPGVKWNFNTRSASNTSGLGGEEGYASVADPNTGALLFYSDGGKCWNSSNAVMANGNGLLGNSLNDGYSTAQGVCIVPVPGQTKKYYLFSLESGTDPGVPVKLYYSIVDMNLNNGLGDIVTGSKNIILDGNSMLSESMLAIQGDNCDVWLMLHTTTTPTFKAYHITTAGIDPTPVLSTTGGQIQGSATIAFIGELPAYGQSTLTISPNRKKLALSCVHLASLGTFPVLSSTGRSWGGLLCDFDAETGMVSNGILTDTVPQYSAAFSPDNSKLYYTSVYVNGLNTPSRVSQLTITSNDSATIAASRTVVMPSINGGTSGKLIGMRMYRDSIYIVNPFLLSFDRINKPNLAGAACNYQSNAISFPGATGDLGSTLPAEIVYAPRPDTLRSRMLDTTVCKWTTGIKLRAADQTIEDNYTWSNNTSDSTLTVTAAGTYWVRYGNSCHYRIDTFVLTGSDLNPVITVNGFQLGTAASYTTYQWYLDGVLIPGAVNSTYTASENGAYTVVVSDGTCTASSAVYHVTNVTGIEDLQHLAGRIKVYPNPAADLVYIKSPVAVDVQLTGIEGRTILTAKSAGHISIRDLAAGIYLLRITDKNGTILKVEKLIRAK